MQNQLLLMSDDGQESRSHLKIITQRLFECRLMETTHIKHFMEELLHCL